MWIIVIVLIALLWCVFAGLMVSCAAYIKKHGLKSIAEEVWEGNIE